MQNCTLDGGVCSGIIRLYMKKLLIVIFFLSVCSGFSFAQFGKGVWFEPGKTYFILQYRANVREQPSLDSPVIAVLSLGNIVEILERSTWVVINHYPEYWYKIKCNDIVGYTFGGNLALERLIVDIDNNGTNDYFSYRSRNFYSDRDIRMDIFVFINNQRINTTMLNIYSSNYELQEPDFGWCEFEEQGNYVLMKLSLWGNISQDGNNYIFKNIYKINANGTIEFTDWELGNIRGRDYRNTRTTESDLQRPLNENYWEWYTLEAYEKYPHKTDLYIDAIFISTDGQLWLKTVYMGK